MLLSSDARGAMATRARLIGCEFLASGRRGLRPVVAEAWRSGFEGHGCGSCCEADGVVPADEHEQVEKLRFSEGVVELSPQVVVDGGRVVERVGQLDGGTF